MYGGMELVALLHERLSRRKAYLAQIEPMLLEHVVPEMAAAEGYVRMQACSVLERYGKVRYAGQLFGYLVWNVWVCVLYCVQELFGLS
jgi:hypothetical protein